MKSISVNNQALNGLVLVLGATGKSGRRMVQRLDAKKVSTRICLPSAISSFDWNNEAQWDNAPAGVNAVSISYTPDLAMPGATDSIQTLGRPPKDVFDYAREVAATGGWSAMA